MRLFLIALAVIYVVMVSFVETIGLGPSDVSVSGTSAPGFGDAPQNITAHSLAAPVPVESAAVRAGSSPPCGAPQTGGQTAAAGCAEYAPRGR